MRGVARKVAKEEGGSKAEKQGRADCGLGYKYQQSACDMLVMRVHGEVAPGVVTRSSKVWEGLLYVEGCLGSF